MPQTTYKVQAEFEDKNVQSSVEGIKSSVDQLASSLGGQLAKSFGVVAIGTKVFGMLKQSITELAAEARQFQSISRRFNMPIGQVQDLKAVAEESGVSLNQMARGLKGVEKTFADAATNPSGKKGALLRSLGISPEDLKSSSDDAKSSLVKLRDIIRRYKDEEVRDRVGQELVGTQYNIAFKMAVEMDSDSFTEATSAVEHLTDAQIASNAGFGKLGRDFAREAKGSFQWLMDALTATFTVLKMVWDFLILGLVEVKLTFQALGSDVMAFFEMMMRGIRNTSTAWAKFKNWMHMGNEEENNKTIEENEKANQKSIDDRKKIEDKLIAADKANDAEYERRQKENLTRLYVSALSLQDSTGLGSSEEEIAKEQASQDEKKAELLKRKAAAEATLKEHPDSESAKSELAKIAEEMKDQQEEQDMLDEVKNRIHHKNEEGTEGMPDLEKEKRLKQEFEERWKTIHAQTEELSDAEKLNALLEQKAELIENIQELNEEDAEANKERVKYIQAQLDKIEAQYGRLVGKINKEQQKEDLKVDEQRTKEKEKNEDKLAARKRELMKKNGASQQQIDKEEFNDDLKKLAEMESLWHKAEADANDPKNKDRVGFKEKAQKAKEAFDSQFWKTQGAMDKLIVPAMNFASDAAKKGWGGGHSHDPMVTLVDLNSKQVQHLGEILRIIEQETGADSGTTDTNNSTYGGRMPSSE